MLYIPALFHCPLEVGSGTDVVVSDFSERRLMLRGEHQHYVIMEPLEDEGMIPNQNILPRGQSSER